MYYMGEYGFSEGTLIINGNEIGKVTDFNTSSVIEHKDVCGVVRKFHTNKEININISNVRIFPNKLGKYYYLMHNAKKLRIRNKNEKIYFNKLCKLFK